MQWAGPSLNTQALTSQMMTGGNKGSGGFVAQQIASRGLRRRATRRVSSPNTYDWIETYVKPLAERKIAGEDPRVIGEELFFRALPWVRSQIRKEIARQPAGADQHETHSRMLVAAWRVSMEFDPTRPVAWPTALRAALRGAWLEAYRNSDFLTRKHRAIHNAYRNAAEQLVQLHNRDLTYEEQMALARTVAPPSQSTDWATVLLNRTPPPPLGGLGQDLIIDTTDNSSSSGEPESVTMQRETTNAINDWLDLLPEDLRQQVNKALDNGRTVSAKCRRDLAPYLEALPGLAS